VSCWQVADGAVGHFVIGAVARGAIDRTSAVRGAVAGRVS
jgi:hypothetical protein